MNKQQKFNATLYKNCLLTGSIILVILLTASSLIFLGYIQSLKKKLSVDPSLTYRQTYTYLSPQRRIIKSEDLVVNLQPIREYLKSLPEQNKDWANMSIYLEMLNTGSNVTVNTDFKTYPASLAKLPVAMAAMKKVENNQWTLQTKIKMDAADADTVRTPDIARDIGREYDVKFLLERLLKESDNTAYRMLVKNFSSEELEAVGKTVGLEYLLSPEGKISAKDYSRLFRMLAFAAYLNESNSQFLLDLMVQSDYKTMLKSGLPSGTKLAHKWATNIAIGVYSDAGIVYVENRPYIISVMIEARDATKIDENQARADAVMKGISQKTYEYIKNF